MKIDRRLRPAFWVFAVLLALALLRDGLANGRPLYCRLQGQVLYPGLRSILIKPEIPYGNSLADSLELSSSWLRYRDYEAVFFAPIPFSPGQQERRADNLMQAQPPGSLANDNGRGYRHWLGTDPQGRDVLAGLIAGARVSLLIGLVTMGLAFLIGTLLGALAGFWGDDRLQTRLGRILMTLLGGLTGWFYAFVAGPGVTVSAAQWIKNLFIFLAITLIFNYLGKWLSRLPGLSKPVIIPVDLLVMRFSEIFNALPKFIFLLIIARLYNGQQSIFTMVALIGAFSWPGVASLVRAELLRVRALDFVTAARALGLPELRVLLRHALPNALRSAYTAVALGVGSAILLETSLAFLGLSGRDMQGASWGMLLHAAHDARTAWWLVLSPGLAICVTVLALNKVGEVLSERK